MQKGSKKNTNNACIGKGIGKNNKSNLPCATAASFFWSPEWHSERLQFVPIVFGRPFS